jgi:hypothetical protein
VNFLYGAKDSHFSFFIPILFRGFFMKTVFIEALKDTPEKWVHFLPYVVRHPHLDLVGHMNNSQYLSIFEEGRWNFLAHFGVDQNYLMRECIAPVITQANLSFYK